MHMYQRVRLRSSHAGLQWHVACWTHGILVYRFNKQASHVLLTIQFDTNVSQLLRHVLSWSCDPLSSLGELSWVDWIDCLYVCRVCFDCASHQRCTVGIYCVSAASEWPCFQRKKGFFFYFFPKKWTPAIKKIKKTVLVSPDVSLTSVVIRQPRLPFCDMKLTLFCVSTASGLLHDVFQYVSAHFHPHWNLLWNAQLHLTWQLTSVLDN